MSDKITAHMRGEFDLPVDWHWSKVERVGPLDDDDKSVVLVTGARYPHLVTRGPSKGEPNFRRKEGRAVTLPIPMTKYRDLTKPSN